MTVRKLAVTMLCSTVLGLLTTNQAQAASFTFEKIVDTNSLFRIPVYEFDSPAINDEGTVAFSAAYANNQDSGTGIFSTNGKKITTIVDTNGTNGSFSSLGTPSLNNFGTVAFQGERTLNKVSGVGFFTGNGGLPATVYFDNNAKGILVSRPSINDKGTVAFADNEFGNIYINSNGKITSIANTNGGNPVINNQGTVSFILPDKGLVTRNGQVTTTIANTNNLFSSLSGDGSPLNEEGTVAFLANLLSGGEGIFTGNGASLTTIADTSGDFDGFGASPAINDDGKVAFWAFLKSGGEGIFTGSDIVKNKVIATGDNLLDSKVTGIESFDLQGLNNRGQIVFAASLANGTQGIYVATPENTNSVPEPSFLFGELIVGVGAVWLRLHKHK
ncbi:hypothetical protein I8752_18730 [Nostocaceae cyanobacterium CENA369]|uniref:Uncharacterized protein n=2 Tax=Dendronalium TaxID=2840442 RepID=A0A8J7I6C7_9NOST|nr:choice-of-anchor tandem repeat NxxGxxAF-containing protein [Dendronalium phyllosphericum]MBH8575013.1 hypothetical protein [Dendronalium phyllosphericum CENA369]